MKGVVLIWVRQKFAEGPSSPPQSVLESSPLTWTRSPFLSLRRQYLAGVKWPFKVKKGMWEVGVGEGGASGDGCLSGGNGAGGDLHRGSRSTFSSSLDTYMSMSPFSSLSLSLSLSLSHSGDLEARAGLVGGEGVRLSGRAVTNSSSMADRLRTSGEERESTRSPATCGLRKGSNKEAPAGVRGSWNLKGEMTGSAQDLRRG